MPKFALRVHAIKTASDHNNGHTICTNIILHVYILHVCMHMMLLVVYITTDSTVGRPQPLLSCICTEGLRSLMLELPRCDLHGLLLSITYSSEKHTLKWFIEIV